MSEATIRTADTTSRDRARVEFERPVILVAGAGTGKTSTLVARVVTWITGPGWERAVERAPDASAGELAKDVLERVVAITFTDAAAAEMGTRIDEALEKFSLGEEVKGLRIEQLAVSGDVLDERMTALRQEIDALSAGTFHSWCRRLIATHPIEAGLSPGFTIDATGYARGRAVRDAFVELLADEDEQVADDLVALAADGYGPAKLEELAIKLLKAGASTGDVDPAAFEDPREGRWLFDHLAALMEPFRPFLADIATQKKAQAARALAEAMQALDADLREDPPSSRRAWSHFTESIAGWFDDKRITYLGNWVTSKSTQTLRDILGDDLPKLVAPSKELARTLRLVSGNDVQRAVVLARLLGRVIERHEQLEVERGFLGFDQILRAAERLLRLNPTVAADVRAGIDLLLVDEFQDTDSVQCAIVGRLALEGKPRPSLFLVGDPKQSIYSFRGADMAAFDAFEQRVLDANGLRLELSVNFRSVPAVLAEVDRLFASTFERIPGLQPAFASLIPGEGRTDDGLPPGAEARIEHWVGWGPNDAGALEAGASNIGPVIAREGAAIAADLLRLKRADPAFDWRDAAVLVATQTEIEAILEPLRAAGIPFDVKADREYYQRREVVDAVSSIRAAFDAEDHLALVSLLRAPFVGVPDAALLPLWHAGFPEALRQAYDGAGTEALHAAIARAHERTPRDVEGIEPVAGWDARLRGVVATLVAANRASRKEPLDRALTVLRTGLGQERVEAARYLGAWRLANLARLWRRLYEATAADTTDVPSLLRSLRKEMTVGEPDTTGAASRSTQSAVRVMTLHGSKGLEFAHVYVAQLSRQGRNSGKDSDPLLFGVDEAVEPRCAWNLAGHTSPAYPVLVARARDVEAAERVRKLYVAATRAKERLVLSSAREGDQAIDWRDAANFDGLLRARTDSSTLLTQLLAKQASAVDRFGAAWRLTAQFEAQDPLEDDATEHIAFSDEHVRDAASDLAAARLTAAARADRARSGGPSVHAAASAPRRSAPPLSPEERERARAIGTLVHAWFESGGEVELEQLAASRAPGTPDAAVVEQARAVLERAERSGLVAQHAALSPLVVGRELPYLAPPSAAPDAPVDAELGVIDLLLHDPAAGHWTVIDFKTDQVESDAEIAAAVERHAPQLEAYARAVASATGGPVHKELWFLVAGRREAVGAPVTKD